MELNSIAVEVHEAGVSYDGGETLTPLPVSFSVPRSQALVIIQGANGSGKSSLLRAILGLQAVHTGRISSVVDLNRTAAVGYQRDGTVKSISLEDNLRLVGAKESDMAAELLLAGLQDRRRTFGGLLSGGEARTLQVVRARLSARQYWFLDEPTAELDAMRAEYVIRSVIRHVSSGGVAVCAMHGVEIVGTLLEQARRANAKGIMVMVERGLREMHR